MRKQETRECGYCAGKSYYRVGGDKVGEKTLRCPNCGGRGYVVITAQERKFAEQLLNKTNGVKNA